ncbi:universal stress protein [Colwellia psychrerythraea]|uniref:UspA domain-containing protein n=1 Tax=Colwellia psychrerythraea TaxID=28229 RepID=A0A099KAL9_COLPS|nr:universal stress protein [Colwellia psychrerythraea]KGJ86613.1 UspA domain-containing protein [Colwellia psychrerythraea]
MKKIANILVVMDAASDHQSALVQAINIAEKTSANIELFLVAYNSQFVSHWNFSQAQLDVLQKEYIASKLRWLETYSLEVKSLDIVVNTDVVWHSDLSCAVLAKIASIGASIVIKSTKQDSTLNRIFFTPADWQLLEHCPVPLLLTKNVCNYSYRTMMAAVDPERTHDKPEMLDANILQAELVMAELFDSEVHVCHCYQPMGIELWQGLNAVGMDHSIASGDFNDYSDAIKFHHQVVFDELLSQYTFDEKSTHLVAGSPEYELPELVKTHEVDLLVMGMGNNGKFIGNTIEKILDNVECDILSIRCLK